MANQYENPDAEHVHITHINDTREGLEVGLDNCQIAIQTDYQRGGETVPVLAFKDHNGVYHEVSVADNLAHRIEDHTNLPSSYVPILSSPVPPPSGYGLLFLDANDGNVPKIITPDGSMIRLVWEPIP